MDINYSEKKQRGKKSLGTHWRAPGTGLTLLFLASVGKTRTDQKERLRQQTQLCLHLNEDLFPSSHTNHTIAIHTVKVTAAKLSRPFKAKLPLNPDAPGSPIGPVGPTSPLMPRKPGTPGKPGLPVSPWSEAGPGGPRGPGGPGRPRDNRGKLHNLLLGQRKCRGYPQHAFLEDSHCLGIYISRGVLLPKEKNQTPPAYIHLGLINF